jgi:hypothetical protein
MALNNTIVYDQMGDTFYKGDLAGEAMLKCNTMVENSVKTFFGEQVNMSSILLLDRILSASESP